MPESVKIFLTEQSTYESTTEKLAELPKNNYIQLLIPSQDPDPNICFLVVKAMLDYSFDNKLFIICSTFTDRWLAFDEIMEKYCDISAIVKYVCESTEKFVFFMKIDTDHARNKINRPIARYIARLSGLPIAPISKFKFIIDESDAESGGESGGESGDEYGDDPGDFTYRICNKFFEIFKKKLDIEQALIQYSRALDSIPVYEAGYLEVEEDLVSLLDEYLLSTADEIIGYVTSKFSKQVDIKFVEFELENV